MVESVLHTRGDYMSAVSRIIHHRVEPSFCPFSFKLARFAVPHVSSQLYSILCPVQRSGPSGLFFSFGWAWEHEYTIKKKKKIKLWMHSIMGGWILFLFLVSEQATLINKNMTKTQSHFINKKKKWRSWSNQIGYFISQSTVEMK